MDGERGRPGAPGQPVSVKTDLLFPYTTLSLALHKQPAGMLTQVALYALINITGNFRDSLDLADNKDPKGPKEIK